MKAKPMKGAIHKGNLKKQKAAADLSAGELFRKLREGDRGALARAITLCESSNRRHREAATELIRLCLPHSGNSFRMGITGIPGVGKSTFIEALGEYLIEKQDKKVAVLAVDPSSEKSRGSILGDKTRMETLSRHEKAFVRPSPASGSLGGVARTTRESILLCEAARYDLIMVETVGVGQSETAVHSMVDFFVLLMIAGAGDELQGIKRGIMEMADLLVINKADGDNTSRAKKTRAEFRRALQMFPPHPAGWKPRVECVSSVEKTGLEELWGIADEYLELTKSKGYFIEKRKDQARFWMREFIRDRLVSSFFEDERMRKEYEKMERAVVELKMSPFEAGESLLDLFLRSKL